MLLVLEDERPRSWNAFYSGGHWNERRQYAEAIHQLVDGVVRNVHPSLEPFDCRVHIKVTAYFKSRPQDPDNICSKVYIDGLHGTVIHDDTRKYVASVTTISEVDKQNPRVEILITPEI